MKEKKLLKKLVIIIAVVFALFFALVAYMVVKQIQEEKILKQEIINYSNKDLATDDFSITVKTSGDCAYVEEAVKKFYKQLSDNVKTINFYLNNDKLTNILSYENLVKDRPNFDLSHSTIKIAKDKINESFDNIKNLSEEKTIKNLIDKDKLEDSKYYYDLYLSLMYTEKDLETLKTVRKEMERLSNNLNEFLNKIDEILYFLENNNSKVVYSNNLIYFETNEELNQYNKLLSELNELGNNLSNKEIVKKDTTGI